MQSGVNRDGQHLYPTFPYDHFTHVSDDDDRALYAYLMTRQPVRAPARDNDLAFPFNQRIAVAGWKLLFLRHGTYQPDSTKSAEWNRGAYLVEGLAHCGACHTPRNALGAEKTQASFAGGDVDNWHAYAINGQSPAPVPWDADALFRYLRHGWHPDHGVARGPMAEVVSNLSEVPESDVRAIATYMAGVFGAPTPERKRRGDEVLAQASSDAGATGQWRHHDRRAALCRRLRAMPRHRPRAAVRRDQSRAQYRPHRSRRAQRRQHRAVGHPSHRGRTQPDHAGLCRQHERRPDRGIARLSARAFRQPAAWTNTSDIVRDARRTQTVSLASETSHDDIEGQWSGPPDRRRPGYAAALCAARGSEAQRRQVRLRPRPMRRLHRHRRRQGGAVLRHAAAAAGRQEGHDAGRPRHDRSAGADPARLHRGAGGAMRLLHRRHDDAGAGAAAAEFEADRRRDPRRARSPISAAAAPICGSCARCIAPAI